MDIKRLTVGSGSKKCRYFINNNDGETVAYFDDLTTAAVVLRYLKGGSISRESTELALSALRAFDEKNI